jgi:hypothetical protein
MTENVVEDANVVSLASLRGYRVTPFRKNSGKVAFIVHGDLEHLLAEILENRPVPIGDYLKNFKAVRSTIYTLKNSEGGGNDD